MTWDVAVVGLGSAGAAAAALCARRGLRVVALDSRSRDRAGASWTNGVPDWVFDAVGLARPLSPERHPGTGHFRMIAGWGPIGMRVHGMTECDMPLLTQRLQQLAIKEGAELRDCVKVHGLEGGVLRTSAGAVNAHHYVDASGLTGVRLLNQPRVSRTELCVAAQEVREVTDYDSALEYLGRHKGREGEALGFSGIEGGYSVVMIRIGHGQMGILTGSIPGLGHLSGKLMLNRFVRRHPWVGKKISGGSRAIPLCSPLLRVGVGEVAAIGDAACQIFSPHGSGVAQGILAANVLARTLANGGSPEDYNVTWQRRYGGHLAGATVFRRFSQSLSVDELSDIIERQVLSPLMVRNSLIQRPPRPPKRALLRSGRGMAQKPQLAPRMLSTLARMKLIQEFYRLYPRNPSKIPQWARQLARLAR